MHAVGWIALCVEGVVVAVNIQPIAERLYEVSVHSDHEPREGVILRRSSGFLANTISLAIWKRRLARFGVLTPLCWNSALEILGGYLMTVRKQH